MADETQVESVLKRAWQSATRCNPMLMIRLRADYDFERLRQMIRDCFAKGLSGEETVKHTVSELLNSAKAYVQPSDACADRHSTPETAL